MNDFTESTGTPWETRKSSIRKVIIESGITRIGSVAFLGCSNLTEVELPSGLISIGDSSFADCRALTKIDLPDGIKSIGSDAFQFSGISSIRLPDSLTSIGDSAFQGCYTLTYIEIPGSVSEIGFHTFDMCSRLQTVKLNEGVKTIGEVVFGAQSLTTVYLPKSLENIDYGAFGGCNAITDVYYSGTEEEANLIQIGTGNTYLSSATWHYQYISEEETLTLSSTLTTIQTEAFSGVGARKIIIPTSVVAIESRAFAECENLEELYFEGSPYNIADDILSGCRSVKIYLVKESTSEKWAIQQGLTVYYR